MSKVTISGNASGTGTLTIAAPNTNSDITLNLPTTMGTNDTNAVVTTDAAGNLGLGVAPTFASGGGVQINNTASADARLRLTNAGTGTGNFDGFDLSVTSAGQVNLVGWENQPMTFLTNATERVRISAAGTFFTPQATPVSKAATVTLTGAEVLTGIVLASGTGFTLTLPTGTALDTATGGMAVNTAFDFTLIKTDSSSVTLAINTGITTPSASQSLIISAVSSATYRLRKTAANTFVMYRIT